MTYNLYDFANEKNVKLSGSSWLDSTPDVIFGDIKTLEQSSYYDSELLEDLLELLENVKSKHENLVNYYKDGSKTIEEKEQEITRLFRLDVISKKEKDEKKRGYF